MPRFFKFLIGKRNCHVIRAGDPSNSKLKIGWTKGGKYVYSEVFDLKPTGGTGVLGYWVSGIGVGVLVDRKPTIGLYSG